jgi:hypothetical protein
MSGAISALTRGRVTPEVGRRVPRTTAGEGMFDVMAGIGRGGTQFLEGQRGREEREEALEMYREDRDIAAEQETYERGQTLKDREDDFELELRRRGLSEEKIAEELRRWNLEHGLEKEKVATGQYSARTGRIEALAPKSGEGAPFSASKLNQIFTVLELMEQHNEDPKFGETRGLGSGLGSWGTVTEILSEWGMPGMNLTDAKKNRDYFDTLTTSLVFNVLKPMSEEGRLTKDDFENLEKMAGQPSMDLSLRRVLLKNVRNSVEQAISTRPGTHQQWGRRGGTQEGGGAGTAEAEQIMDEIRALAEAGKDVPEELLERAKGAGITIPGVI